MNALTVKQYAKKRGVSKVAVTRAMQQQKKLIGVERYEKLGRDWFLWISNDVAKIKKGKCIEVIHE